MRLAQERLAKGLCPSCGAEAAPYRLCGRCREMATIRRGLKIAAKAGVLNVEKRGGKLWFTAGDMSKVDNIRLSFAFEGRKGWEDGRYRPRLGRVPVDVERELIEIFRTLGRPATIDEILTAWGRLREQRKHASVAGDMAALIAAQRRREERAAKRLRSTWPAAAAGPREG